MPEPIRHPQPIPFITLPNWVKAAARCGFNIEPVFRKLGIQTDLIHLESATVAVPVLERAMEACIARTRRGHFPFVLGETFAFDYLGQLLLDAPRVFRSGFITANIPGGTGSQTFNTISGGKDDVGLNNGAVGVKINLAGQLLLTADVLFRLDNKGLRQDITPLIGLSYVFRK